MAPSRALPLKNLLRAADEEVPPQRRKEGEPPPRRAAFENARRNRLYTPRPAPPTTVMPPTPIGLPSE
eukprot:5872719-Pyramimonas_sp.AAC.1